MEDNGLKNRPVEMQERVAAELEKNKMTLGIFVLNIKTGFKGGGSPTTGKPGGKEGELALIKAYRDADDF